MNRLPGYPTYAESLERMSIPEPNSGCLLWTGDTSRTGYGRISVNGKPAIATHIALLVAGRPRPPGAFACHTCDVRQCVNPDHLYWGDSKTNMADRVARGRYPGNPHAVRGEAHCRAVLTEEIVWNIRVENAAGVPRKELMKRYGIKSDGHLCHVIHGQRWAHVPMPAKSDAA